MVRSGIALVLACILAPIFAVSIGTVAYVGEFRDTGSGLYLGPFAAAMFGAWFGVVVGIPTMLLVGLPLHFYLQSRGMNRLAPYAFGGALAGFLAALVFMMWPPADSWTDFVSRWSNIVSGGGFTVKILVFGALTGVLAASLFWFLHRLGRPSPNPVTSAP